MSARSPGLIVKPPDSSWANRSPARTLTTSNPRTVSRVTTSLAQGSSSTNASTRPAPADPAAATGREDTRHADCQNQASGSAILRGDRSAFGDTPSTIVTWPGAIQ